MIDVVEKLKAELKDQPHNPLRPTQMREYDDELTQISGMTSGRDMDGRPAMDGPAGQSWLNGAKGASLRRAKQIHDILAKQAPKKITGDRASRVHALVTETLETVIKPAMLPRSALRRNPPSAVGHLLRTEFNGEFKDGILAVKRGLRALDPDNADPDFTNMERFRPEGNGDGTSTFMADAQIPGVFGMSNRAKENWPLGDATARTAVGEARQRETATKTRKPPPIQEYRCDAEGCDFSRRGGFGKALLAKHREKEGHG